MRAMAEACSSSSELFLEAVAETKWLLHLRLIIRGG